MLFSKIILEIHYLHYIHSHSTSKFSDSSYVLDIEL